MLRRSFTASIVVAAASLVCAASAAHAAPGDLPRLTGVAPTGAAADWYDDHSVSGDNHLSWSPAAGEIYVNVRGEASQREPHDVEWQSAIQVGGPGDLQICGYPSGTVGWMRAYQLAPGDLAACPAQEPGSGRFGWFRYVYGRHEEQANRWHVMDLERSALVPLDGSLPTVWDNHWGTCLNYASANLNCEGARNVPGLQTGVAGGEKITATGEVDAQTIPLTVPSIPDGASGMLADGQYQIVTLTNPYGLIKEDGGAIGSVQCVNVTLDIPRTGDPGEYGLPTITPSAQLPADCLLPTQLDPALTGPGGADPMAGADTIPACTFTGSHCWPIANSAPHVGPDYDLDELDFLPARSLATGNPAVTPRMSIARGSAIPAAVAATGLPRPGVTPAVTVPVPGAATLPRPSVASSRPSSSTRSAGATARSHTRTALRRVFGTGLSSLRVSCRLRPASAATCSVSWRKRGARYSGKLYLRTLRINGRSRWQYRVDVTRRTSGRTTHVRRAYRTGGTVGTH